MMTSSRSQNVLARLSHFASFLNPDESVCERDKAQCLLSMKNFSISTQNLHHWPSALHTTISSHLISSVERLELDWNGKLASVAYAK
jgi:hypothetical protein